MNEKAELTTQQIVLLVILIASFAVLLLFLFKLDLGKESDKELCHNSVITRGNALIPTDAVPLNCKRSYVCLSMDGSCEEMTSPEIKEVETEQDVYQVLADELVECWWMFGEGKVNYVGKETFENLYCSLCSQIAFDGSVKEIFPSGEINKKEFFNYLDSKQSSSGESYFKYIYGYDFKDSNFRKDLLRNYSINSQYYSLMGLKSQVSDFVAWGSGALIVAGVVATLPILGPTSIPIGTALIAGGALGEAHYITSLTKESNGLYFLRPSLIEVNSPEFKSLKCDSIATLS